MISDDSLSRIAIMHTVAAFRLGREAEANEDFLDFIDKLGRLLHFIPQGTLADLTALMQKTFDAQSRQDHIGVADLLEYELLKNLQTTGLLID